MKNKIFKIFKKDNLYVDENISEEVDDIDNDENTDEDYEDGIEDISIEEIDKDVELGFFLDKDRLEEIKAPYEMKSWVREAIEKVEKEKKEEKRIENRKRTISLAAASIGIVLLIGTYNPALAHNLPAVEKLLKTINKSLKVDEIAAITGIDNIIPKATVDKDDNIKFVKPTEYKVNKLDIEKDIEEDTPVDINDVTQNMPIGEYESVQFIHKMSNTIIKAKDNRKYGEIPITPTNIKIAQAIVKNINSEDAQNYLNNELHKWKNGDFDNGVDVHNYVWHMLNGEIGKAISLDCERIDNVKNTYFK